MQMNRRDFLKGLAGTAAVAAVATPAMASVKPKPTPAPPPGWVVPPKSTIVLSDYDALEFRVDSVYVKMPSSGWVSDPPPTKTMAPAPPPMKNGRSQYTWPMPRRSKRQRR